MPPLPPYLVRGLRIFGTVALILKDGSSVAGALKKEAGGKITMQTADGKTQVVSAAQVKQRTPAVSSMPPMGAILKPKEIRDIIEYLSTLK